MVSRFKTGVFKSRKTTLFVIEILKTAVSGEIFGEIDYHHFFVGNRAKSRFRQKLPFCNKKRILIS